VLNKENIMLMLAATALPVAAAGWSLLYLLLGGGLGGAILIFIVLKMLGK
jgi:hypothetical protein